MILRFRDTAQFCAITPHPTSMLFHTHGNGSLPFSPGPAFLVSSEVISLLYSCPQPHFSPLPSLTSLHQPLRCWSDTPFCFLQSFRRPLLSVLLCVKPHRHRRTSVLGNHLSFCSSSNTVLRRSACGGLNKKCSP